MSQGNYGEKKGMGSGYPVDMVFCIDATGSMEDTAGNQMKLINMVKQNALSFYDDFAWAMKENHKRIAQLRVRVVVFRDFLADGMYALQESDFFRLPDQAEAFESFIQNIHADGGGDEPEDGLEAVACAIKSDWSYEGTKQRHIIVVWSDAGTHVLGHGKESPFYPKGMPKGLSELQDWWEKKMKFESKRMVIFAPNTTFWNYLSDQFDNVWHLPTKAGSGISEMDYSYMIHQIAAR